MICAVLKKPQLDQLTVTGFIQSHSDNAILTSTSMNEVKSNYKNIEKYILNW